MTFTSSRTFEENNSVSTSQKSGKSEETSEFLKGTPEQMSVTKSEQAILEDEQDVPLENMFNNDEDLFKFIWKEEARKSVEIWRSSQHITEEKK